MELFDLGLTIPVLAAPMAGGGTTPSLVVAAARAGGLGFLAAGYKTPAVVAGEIAAVRGAGVPFGVNVFAPNPVSIADADYRRYATRLQPDADRYGLTLPADPIDDDDFFNEKVDLLLEADVPIVSFTFGLPGADVIRRLHRAGVTVVQTVTSRREAELAAAAGVDVLTAQASAAGGHSGTFTPAMPLEARSLTDLIADMVGTVDLPVIAAGGISLRTDVTAALAAGADAVSVGTLLLRTEESGASPVHQTALADPARTHTVITRAFTGRPARGLANRFIAEHESTAPLGYPAVHHLTSALRKAAARAGEADLVHLWAGTGYREARRESVESTLTRLTP